MALRTLDQRDSRRAICPLIPQSCTLLMAASPTAHVVAAFGQREGADGPGGGWHFGGIWRGVPGGVRGDALAPLANSVTTGSASVPGTLRQPRIWGRLRGSGRFSSPRRRRRGRESGHWRGCRPGRAWWCSPGARRSRLPACWSAVALYLDQRDAGSGPGAGDASGVGTGCELRDQRYCSCWWQARMLLWR